VSAVFLAVNIFSIAAFSTKMASQSKVGKVEAGVEPITGKFT